MAAKMLAALAAAAEASGRSWWPELPDVRFAISSAKVPACLDVSDPKAWYGSLVQVWECDPSEPKRRWLFRDGAIVHRTSKGDEFCVDLPEDEKGQQLQLHSCTGEARQQFKYTDGMFLSRLGGKCLDLRPEDDLVVQIWDCDPRRRGQRWVLTMLPEASGPTLTVISKASGHCLDLADGGKASGDLLQVTDCDKLTGTQSWTFSGRRIQHRSTADGWLLLGQELCLDIPGDQRFSGQLLQVWTCDGGPQQEFIYQGGAIKTTDGRHCLDVQAEDGRSLQLWECGDSKNQQWSLAVAPKPEPLTVAIYSPALDSCLDLTEDLERNGTKAQVWGCDPEEAGAAQQWRLDGGAVVHRSRRGEELCLEVPKSDCDNGDRLRVWACSGSERQQFILEDGQLRAATNSSKCVDVAEEDGRSVQLWDCGASGWPSQQWTMVPLQPELLV